MERAAPAAPYYWIKQKIVLGAKHEIKSDNILEIWDEAIVW